MQARRRDRSFGYGERYIGADIVQPTEGLETMSSSAAASTREVYVRRATGRDGGEQIPSPGGGGGMDHGGRPSSYQSRYSPAYGAEPQYRSSDPYRKIRKAE